MLTKHLEYAWAAGFFEGEGNIKCIPSTYAKKRGYNSYSTQLTMTQKGTADSPPDVLLKFADLFPGGKIYREKGKDLWRWTMSQKGLVKSCLMSMLPWLGERRSKAAHECIQQIINSPYRYRKLNHGILVTTR